MDKQITAELDHPEIQGPPLERGTRYGHHFVVELISDGRRLWAVASEEGRKILHQIAHGLTGEEPEVDVGNRSGTGTELVTDPGSAHSISLDPDGSPATGGAPQPISGAAAPTTVIGPANSFDS